MFGVISPPRYLLPSIIIIIDLKVTDTRDSLLFCDVLTSLPKSSSGINGKTLGDRLLYMDNRAFCAWLVVRASE